MEKIILDKIHHQLCDFWSSKECSCCIVDEPDHFVSPMVSEIYEVKEEDTDILTNRYSCWVKSDPHGKSISGEYWYSGLDTSSDEFRIRLRQYTREVQRLVFCKKCFKNEMEKYREGMYEKPR